MWAAGSAVSVCNQKLSVWLISVTFNIHLGYDSALVIMWYSIDLLDKIYFRFGGQATELCWLSC